MGRQPVENGLPQYVSKNARSGSYQYYRRPPQAVKGAAFVRSFRSKDRKAVNLQYAAIHAEAEAYFDRLISGRTISDQVLNALAASLYVPLRDSASEAINSTADLDAFIDQHGSDQMKALVGPDRTRLHSLLETLYRHTQKVEGEALGMTAERKRNYLAGRFGRQAVPKPSGDSMNLMRAFEEAWKPAAKRSEGSIAETKRYVEAFIALNDDLALHDYTRDHWAKWRAQCLELYGPGHTALKRFSMVKTVIAEAIRAGVFERKHHAGQDVVMRRPPRTQLRNEGWSDDEITTLFGSRVFHDIVGKHGNAQYWVTAIIALTGARLSEVTGMRVPDVGQRHAVLTFFLARDEGKTEDSRRIIPVPQKLVDLGLLEYIATLDPNGPLFPTANADQFTNWFGRYRKTIGLNRKGCDLHAFRHHMKTKLGDVACPDRISNWITGHAADNVGATYGKTEFETALRFLNQIDLGVKIPRWRPK
jgi:integrase